MHVGKQRHCRQKQNSKKLRQSASADTRPMNTRWPLSPREQARLEVAEIIDRWYEGGIDPEQPDKLASDLLKMALVEKLTDRAWRKIMCFCDESAAITLKGRSWLAAAAHFAVEVIVVDIPEKTREALLMAQKRQKMVNRPADEQ